MPEERCFFVRDSCSIVALSRLPLFSVGAPVPFKSGASNALLAPPVPGAAKSPF